MQAAAVRWGFPGESVGLVTGNRQVNPDAPVRVVVAEILLNRLLRPGNFDFDRVAVVVKDEFHTFRDPERGIVWELSLSLLPKHVRLLLLSATVGRPESFTNWLRKSHGRQLQLLQGRERRVPLTYQWVDDLLLEELLVELVRGREEGAQEPCLVFCFNRRECWSVAERLKGRPWWTGTGSGSWPRGCGIWTCRTEPDPSCGNSSCGAWESTMPGSCPSTVVSWSGCSSAGCCRWSSARRPCRPASTFRPGPWS